MLLDQRIVVVMPAYNAERTLERTWAELPHDLVDEVILVDDASRDGTADLAERLGLTVLVHDHNLGYGANQKTCYRAALDAGADLVVMLHPDYQYSPRLVSALAAMVASGHYDVVLGSRILGRGALAGGMPAWKYIANRALTLVQNWLLGLKLSEYHTGFRAYSRRLLESVPWASASDDFVFDNQILAQAAFHGFAIGEISCPTRYFPEASSIGFSSACRYGLGVLVTSVAFRLARWGLARGVLFGPRRGGRA